MRFSAAAPKDAETESRKERRGAKGRKEERSDLCASASFA
jgi:hypothetical protein